MNEWFPTFRAIGNKVRHTPMRDVVRLHLSGRLDWQARVAASDLPANAKQKITDVVKATRLWRLEKSQIADELIAHMLDGQQRGQSAEAIVANFGETKPVALLMRSAKKRNRPLVWKALVAGAYAFAAFLVFYAGLAVWYFSGRPNPSVDYFAVVSADALAVPESDRAWPIYRDAWTKYQFHQLDIAQLLDQQEGEAWNGFRPGDEKWPNLVAFLQEHQPLVEAFREAGLKPGMGLELKLQRDYATEDLVAMVGTERANEIQSASNVEPDGLMDDAFSHCARIPHVSALRHVAWVLAADSFRAAEAGDAETVVRNIEAMVGLGPQAAEQKFLVCGYFAMAMEYMVYNTIQGLVSGWPSLLDDGQLLSISKRLRSFEPRQLLGAEAELAGQKDVVQRIYTDDGNGDGRLTPVGVSEVLKMALDFSLMNGGDYDVPASLMPVAGPAVGVLSSSRKEMEQLFDRVYLSFQKGVGQPVYKQPIQAESEIKELIESISVTDFARTLLEVLLPAMDYVRAEGELVQASRDATLVALAAHRFRLRHDRYPQSVDALVPEFMQQVPPDPLTGEPIRYLLIAGQPTIYSVGHDGDDDQGVPARDGASVLRFEEHLTPRPSAAKINGDWVLWPQQLTDSQ